MQGPVAKSVPLHTKRFLDIVLASTALVLLVPVLLLVAVVVRIALGSPIFFRHKRPGLNGTPFVLTKFRTMVDKRDEAGNPLPDADRLTGFGRFLRKTSLDELPTLWHVVRGDMSLVGPRPLLMQYLELYTDKQARRHDVVPGITGWAQIHGRNAISWEDRLALDVWYVDNWSLWLDVRILVATALTVIKREGISHAETATMPEFRGSSGGNEV